MNNDVVFMAKGKAFSEASSEIMDLLKGWLEASNISEEVLLLNVNRDDFLIEYTRTEDEVMATLYSAGEQLGVPFVCSDLNCLEQYHVDLSLVLLCIANKFNDVKVQKKFTEFINKYLVK